MVSLSRYMRKNVEQPTGEKIKAGRIKSGLSQQDLATKLKVSQPLVSQWERGQAKPDQAQLDALETVLGGITKEEESPDQSLPPVATWLGRSLSKKGSWTEFVRVIVLRSFLENDKFRVECSHALGLEEQVAGISVASAPVDEQPDIAIDCFYYSEPYLDVTVIENAFLVAEQHPRQLLERLQAHASASWRSIHWFRYRRASFFVGVCP